MVCHIKPQWFVMENVEPIRKTPILDAYIHQFKQAEYGLTSTISIRCGLLTSATISRALFYWLLE
ncbi:hypothetical protein [Helicobacter cynogastricus]|uniref:hypothetical protein n=1 Tax=Helicobacter cynogastricus TaxID=329937 RepID=UPI003898DD52